MGIDRSLANAFLLALFLGFVLPSVQAQELPPKVTTFTPEDYDAHSQIFCAEPLPDGRTAFGTFRKVLLYDGETFRHVPVGSGKYVTAMDRDSAGRIFIGGSSTMGVITPDSSGSLVHRSLLPLLPDSLKDFGTVWNVAACGNNGVYFNAYEHLFRYHHDTLEVIAPQERFFNMHTPADRPVIEDGDTGLFRIEGSDRVRLPESGELTKGEGIHAILSTPGDTGKWTVFTRRNGLFAYHPEEGNVRALPGGPEGGWASAKIYTACRLDPEENPFGAAFAVGTNLKGMYLLSAKGKVLYHLGQEEGIPAKLIWHIVPAGSGDLWVSTNSGITLLHTGLPFTLAGEGELFSGSVQAITRPPSPDSPLYLATSQGAWSWMASRGSFEQFPGTAGQCFDLLHLPSSSGSGTDIEGEGGRILVANSEGLLSIPCMTREGKARGTDTVLSANVRPLASIPLPGRDRRGVLAGGRDGLFALSGRSVRHGGSPDTLLSVTKVPDPIRSLAVDRKGSDSLRLWTGLLSKGVMVMTVDTAFTGYRTTLFDTADGLPPGEIWPFPDPLAEERDVVFGTDSGLYRFDGETFLPDDRFGNIFCNGSRQLWRIEKGLDGEVWIDDTRGGRIKHLNPEGMDYRVDSTVFRPLDLGAIRAIHPEEGRTWLGGDQGLACYYPRVEQDHGRAWDCLVRKVFGAGDSLLFGGNYRRKRKGRSEKEKGKKEDSLTSILSYAPIKEQPEGMIPELPYSDNRMEFHYAAPFTDRQEAVKYSYKLAGFDTAWSDWSEKTRKEYTNLPEGSYTFKVKGRNVYLNESSTAEYRFRISPPWYRTWTAYGGYTVAGIGFIWLLLWLNSRRLVAQKERLERTVEERTKEIQEKNQALEKEKREVEKQKERVEEQQQETEKQKEKVEEAHEEITQSIDYAQKIQYALLQSEEHVSPNTPEHFILFKPQSKVSGDFYWAREHKDHLYFAAVDCTGHGVPGAFMSMLGISQLNEIMGTDELLTPGAILTELRERVVRELSGSESGETAKDGMDAALLRIPLDDEGTKTLAFAGAQNPLYVVRKGVAKEEDLSGPLDLTGQERSDRLKPFKKSTDGIEIKGDPMPVGYDEYFSGDFTTVSLKVRKGDMLYMFSDGYADQFGGPKGKKFRYGPFKKLLAELHEKPVEEQKQELDRTFEEWKAESQQEQIDDVVVVGVRV